MERVTVTPVKRGSRWQLRYDDGAPGKASPYVKWGHGSTYIANFRLKREAVAWATEEGILLTLNHGRRILRS